MDCENNFSLHDYRQLIEEKPEEYLMDSKGDY